VALPRKPVRTYRDLEVWQVAMKLTAEIYSISGRFPAEERFGLTAQIRRACVSVVANISEGHARSSKLEYRQFVSIARGSTVEVEAELDVAEMLRYAARADLAVAREHADHVSRMLTNLRRSLSK
jgi:four helix bundle protein